MFTATVRVSGVGRLQDFRESLRWVMVRDPQAEDYTEHHTEQALEYRFELKHGVPFPTLMQVSGDYPELRIEASWETDAVRGRVAIEAGRLVEREIEKKDA